MARKSIQERFWSKVDRSGDCWIWTAYRGITGYGIVGVDRRVQKAHRVAWQLTHGPIPHGACVLHRCDNPPCVNPAHLFLGTQAENVADRDAKGRHVPMSGERHGCAKLTTDQVIAIRADPRIHRLIAADYGVARTVISRIRRREWAHVP